MQEMQSPSGAVAGRDWPFGGRDYEFSALVETLLVDGNSLILAGPSGVGKTRMGRELLAAARAGKIGGDQITATRTAADIPFGAMAALLPDALAPLTQAAASRAALIGACVAELRGRASDRPRLLFVDDMQLLDLASATVIHQAVITGACQLLGALRVDEPTPDAVQALWRDSAVVRHDLGAVSAEQVDEILQGALGGMVDRAAVMQLTSRSRGNLLLLRELVRGAVDAQSLIHQDGIWRLTGPLSLSVRLSELVEQQLAGLDDEDRAVLELVAFGEPIEAALLTELTGAEQVERVERRGLIETAWDRRRQTVGLAHPMYGEWLLARLPALRRARLANTLAEALQATGARRSTDTLRLAKWQLEGGGGDPPLLMRAATAARSTYDFALAERFARAAIAHGAGFESELLAAELAALQGRGAEAEKALAALAKRADSAERTAAVTLAQLDLAIFRGHAETGLAFARESEARLADESSRDQVAARRAGLLFAVEGPRAAAEVVREVLDRSSEPPLYALLVASLAFGRLGRLGAAVEVGEAEGAAQDTYPWLQAFFRGDALLYAGRFREAEERATDEYEIAVREHSVEAQAYFGFQRAKAVAERGNVLEAIRFAREASALFRDLGRPILLEPCLVDVVVGHALSGEADVAASALHELESLQVSPSYYPVEVARARVWVAIARGELGSAREELAAAAMLGEEIGDMVGALDALHLLARLGRARDAKTAAQRVAGEVEGALAAARLAHIEALAGGEPDPLDAVSTTFEEMGADLLAAEAAADAAVGAEAHSTPQRIAVLRRRAAALRERVAEATTPALRSVGARSELTPGETDAALLAAEGYSNREIAERLFLSVRTVEGRLQRCYEKLHVSSRTDLADTLSEAGVDLA